jgi:hypothetical protein
MNKCILTRDVRFDESLFYVPQAEPMTGALQQELAPIIEILESSEDSYTQKFHDTQQESIEDSITDPSDVPESGQTHQSSHTEPSPRKASDTPE